VRKEDDDDRKKFGVPAPPRFQLHHAAFFSQALFKLGLLGDPDKAEKEVNLNLARRLIDMLDLLKDRTKGNLKPEEEKFLESCLRQLRMHYLEKAKVIAP